MEPAETFQSVQSYFSQLFSGEDVMTSLTWSVIFLVMLLIVNHFLKRLLWKRDLTPQQRYWWSKVINYAIAFIGFLLIGAIWFSGIASLATVLGLIAAGLAIALREPIANIAAWGYILWRKPFQLGDRIEVNGIRGDVADLDPFVFLMAEVGYLSGAEQPTGRVILTPNSYVFSQQLVNTTFGFTYVWNEIPVVITFESDWQKAKQVIQSVAEEHLLQYVKPAEEEFLTASSKLIMEAGSFEPRTYTQVVTIGVELTIRYVSPVPGRREIREKLWEDILHRFSAEPDIDYAYPTHRMYFNPREGKPEAGGPASDPGQ